MITKRAFLSTVAMAGTAAGFGIAARWPALHSPIRRASFVSLYRTRRAHHPIFSRASSPRRFRRAKAGT